MRAACRWGVIILVTGLCVLPTLAQTPALPPGVAANVNGQAIPDTAVERGLQRVPPPKRGEARVAVLSFLIENALLDQYLTQMKMTAESKEVEARFEQIRQEIVKNGQQVDKVFKDLMITEGELKSQIDADLRWEKFVTQQGTEAELRKFFDANREAFDGSQVKARHILLTPSTSDAAGQTQAQGQLEAIKKQVEEAAAAALAKLPATADPLTREKARTEALEQTFATLAEKHSSCPTKKNGGDVDWFPRSGGMVEPFARAAFGLKPYQLSEVVRTQFGLHLILPTERRAGKDVKYEDVKAEVKDVYADRLREAVVTYMRPKATITVAPAK